jgi:hypothetical protein
MRIGNRHRPTDKTHWSKIVDIIAQVRGPIRIDASHGKPVSYHGALVTDAMGYVDAELGRASLDDRVNILGHNQQRYPNRQQPFDTKAIGPADPQDS